MTQHCQCLSWKKLNFWSDITLSLDSQPAWRTLLTQGAQVGVPCKTVQVHHRSSCRLPRIAAPRTIVGTERAPANFPSLTESSDDARCNQRFRTRATVWQLFNLSHDQERSCRVRCEQIVGGLMVTGQQLFLFISLNTTHKQSTDFAMVTNSLSTRVSWCTNCYKTSFLRPHYTHRRHTHFQILPCLTNFKAVSVLLLSGLVLYHICIWLDKSPKFPPCSSLTVVVFVGVVVPQLLRCVFF